MFDTLQTLMAFRSVSSDQAAVAKLLEYVEKRLQDTGFVTEKLEHEGIKSLYASTGGQPHAKVMLQAHVDVVPGGEVFSRRDDKIFGRGSYDMLFAVASFLTLIDTLEDPKQYDLSILLTSDEEVGGQRGVGTILNQGYGCDVCVLPDAGDEFGTLSVSAKGVFQLKLKVNGTPHHGSRPWEGDGAANKLLKFLSEFSTAFDPSSRDNSTFVVSQLSAGNEALNQGPGEAFAGIDIRYADAAEYERIRSIFDKLLMHYDIEILHENIAKNFAVDLDSPHVKRFVELYAEHIKKPVDYTKAHGSSDARYFDDKGIPVIMFRPDGGGAHGDEEWISIPSWEKFHDMLEHYVLEIAKTPLI